MFPNIASEKIYVIGLAMHAAVHAERGLRLEEMVFEVSHRALRNAGISRKQLDNVVIAACDELDGRPISSMLMAAPAGGYLVDEIKVTESGLNGLAASVARLRSGEFQAGLVVSWCKSSKTDISAVMRLRNDPFYYRSLNIGGLVSDGMLAQAVASEFAVTRDEIAHRVRAAYARGASNPRGLGSPVPTVDVVENGAFTALPMRETDLAPLSDGAVTLVLCTERFLADNRQCVPLATLSGIGWASDSYLLGMHRLRSFTAARNAWEMALAQSGLSADELDFAELDTPSAWHEAALARIFGLIDAQISPSGSNFSQNPFFCMGLINAAEAVLKLSGAGGEPANARPRRAAAHGCHGFAQQGHVVAIFEAIGGQVN
ncbi:thiolase family protein [Chelatococcus reniformis]|uniref:Acetyl-CoA acetyltransferase n=1 Tax=Chelatococcus reniformis TaxID=1494448 RepID=A0A916XR03_9HYPH|nr:thiolase family protein [Chelatococcus reniformis]GGC93967.1 hypothetical protein GCM10010994_59690 [Chelatococcus reniformis]